MRPPEPVVFVFGATGYVGGATVAAAARAPAVSRVVAHVRPGSPSAERALERFEALASIVAVDRTPLESAPFARALTELRPTHVFLCHGTTKARARTEGIADPYRTVDVALARLVVEAAKGVEPAPRIVALSSVGTSASARGPYLRARWEMEELVRGSGLPFTICRAPLLSGPDRPEPRRGETAARRLLDPLLGLAGRMGMGKLRDRFRSMSASEAAEGLVRSAFHYMTIDRVVESDELRRVGVYERERWTPSSRRDTARH